MQPHFAAGRAGGAAHVRRQVCNRFPVAGREPVSQFAFCEKPENGSEKGNYREKPTNLWEEPEDDGWFSKIFQKKTPGRV